MKITDIPTKRLRLLNSGLEQTTNLTEWLAVDQKKLLRNISKEIGLDELKCISSKLPTVSVPKKIAWIGYEISKLKSLTSLSTHQSDTVRCWACYGAAHKSKNLNQSLKAIKKFAKDNHFGVREIAWMSVRDKICESPELAIKLLKPWAKDKDQNIRRFSSEATRPKGVWAKHIVQFKKDPTPGKDLLDLLFSDTSKYVQDSVGNWLNDAAKDNPQWVKKVVKEWINKSEKDSTKYIIKKATRSL